MKNEFIFDSTRVYDHIKHLAVDIGPRLSGSDGDKMAADYIRAYFKSLGLESHQQMFEVEYATLIEHKLEIVEPNLGEVPSSPVLLTPDTPNKGLTGELVFVDGPQDSRIGPHLAEKIVCWSNPSRLAYAKIIKHRPMAVISIWPGLGLEPKHSQMSARELDALESGAPVTSFWITWEAGLQLLKANAKTAHLRLVSERRQGTSRNIFVELKGTEHPEEIVVIGGHYDTKPGVPGATDNASGVAVVMELARLFTRRESKRTLRFVAWGGEEVGYLGSCHYVNELKQQDETEREHDGFSAKHDKTQLDRHLLCVNLDTLGTTLGYNSAYILGHSDITATINVLSKELGVPHQVFETIDTSDHLPFAWAGVPSISLVREGPPLDFIHTAGDTIDLIDPAQLQQIGTLVEAFLTSKVAEARVYPFTRQIPDELARKVAEIFGYSDCME